MHIYFRHLISCSIQAINACPCCGLWLISRAMQTKLQFKINQSYRNVLSFLQIKLHIMRSMVAERAQRAANRKKQHMGCKCSRHKQTKKRAPNKILYLVVSICSVFLYLFLLWAFAAPAVKLMKMFSWFAGGFSICMCFLKLQRVELSRPS